MSTNHHTAIANGAAANAATFNAPLGQLDAAITTNANDIATNAAAIAAIAFDPSLLPVKARLSLSSTLAIPTSNVTAATTIYLHPFGGNALALYDGSDWVSRALTSAVSLSIPATTSTVYDVFAYWSGSAIVLEAVAWSSATARATALTTQNGVYVKNGEVTKRYMGSFRTTAVSGQCEDSTTKRFLWNMYNRVERPLERQDATASWVYTTATYRQANGNTANAVEVVIGVSEDFVEVEILAAAVASAFSYVGVGVDSTTVNSAALQTGSVTHFAAATARYKGFPGIGYHALNWIEIGGGSGTTTWYGAAGISGRVVA